MANTEEMTDEFIESLMSTPNPNGSNANRNGNGNMSARQRMLQERMEMPMTGGRPAAKVVRASPGSNTGKSTSTRPQARTNPVATNNNATVAPSEPETKASDRPTTTIPRPIIGEVLERPVTNRKTAKSRATKGKVSRFAQQQQLSNTNANSVNGFPSVHVPLGTFVTRKNQNQQQPNPSSSAQTSSPPPLVKRANKNAISQKDGNNINSNNNNNNNNIYQASGKDAEGMLSQMTPDEIREKKQELESALSPEMMAFLKRRGAQKRTQQPQPQPTPTVTPTNKRPPSKYYVDERSEKERLAKLMASVRTHQDLDSAYHAEMQQAHMLEKDDRDDYDDDGKNMPSSSPLQSTDDVKKNNKNFPLACDLLRSTSPRQALWAARIVSKELERRVQDNYSNDDDDDDSLKIPIALSVSLRCLLDNPLSAGGVLHTYMLQSLYSLLLLYAVPDHKLYVSSSAPPSDADIYQDYYMDDAVPTPPLATAYPGASTPQPLTTMVDSDGNHKPTTTTAASAAAYATSSSATSAQADGQAFQKDPMWTLLSKMKIIPRLAQLLSLNADEELPPEAWGAACGILGMLSQRSPGAASAIVHHKTLMRCILDRTFFRLQLHPNDVQTQELTFAVMKLLCAIARQSRATAEALPMQDILPGLLSISPCGALEFRLQQLALCLWRTLLRYGLGLEALSTMLSLAARHWTLPYTHDYSLSMDYLAAFAQVLECAHVARSKRAPATNTGPLQAKHVEILSMASTYLLATQQSALLQASTPPTVRDGNHNRKLQYRWNAARLKFLTAYWGLSKQPQTTATAAAAVVVNEEIKSQDMPMEDGLACLMVLGQWVASGGLVSTACKVIDAKVEDCGGDSNKLEAAACSFIGSVASFLLMMEQHYVQDGEASMMMIKEQSKLIVTRFLDRISVMAVRPGEIPQQAQQRLARIGWINQCHFSISKLYFHAVSSGVLTAMSHLDTLRAFAFGTLGRLQRGDESIAAVLYSQDVLFQSHGNPLSDPDDDNSPSSSPISTMFLGELCGSDRARTQLDHSFKRNHGFGITAGGFGPFSLDSLLSDADQQGVPKGAESLILPMGPLWLWQSLSGCIRMKDETTEKGVQEAANVVSAVLALILEVEAVTSEGDGSLGVHNYSASIPVGAKLYYLMNVCLHSETILREDAVTETAESVFDRYWPQLNPSAVAKFKEECLQHTNPSKQHSNAEGTDGNDDEELDDKDMKLFDMLTQTSSSTSSSDSEWSREEFQSTEAFLEDLATAYTDYGAQYPFFTKCMRVFLSPYFPAKIRLRALRELRGMWHVLTLESETQDRRELAKVLERTILEGNVREKNAPKDSADVLDAVTNLLSQNKISSRPLDGFMLAFSISLLARNLAICLAEGANYQVWKNRLQQLDTKSASLVCEAVSALLSGGGTKEPLIESVLDATSAESQVGAAVDDIDGKIDELSKQFASL
jgi:hypothetical protein